MPMKRSAFQPLARLLLSFFSPSRGSWLMPAAKLSPISQATISMTPWMPNVTISESVGSLVKLDMPIQVV